LVQNGDEASIEPGRAKRVAGLVMGQKFVLAAFLIAVDATIIQDDLIIAQFP